MADNFNLNKFIRNNPLLNESIGGYRDIKPMEEIVSELDKPELIYNEDWINNSVDGKKIGNWSCYYEDMLGVLYWIHDNILSEDVTVYATPNWDGAKGIAVEVQVNYGDHIIDHATIGDPSYPDFESYAQDMAPFLKKVEDKYFAGGYDEYLGSEDNIEEAEGQFQSFDWNTVDQQGNQARLVVDTGKNDAGEEVIRVGHPNTGGTLAMFTKDDILNNDGYLRVGGKNFQVQPSLINWAKS